MPQGKYPRKRKPCPECGRGIDPRYPLCITCSNKARRLPPLPIEESPNPSGLCLCGCGRPTSIAKWSNKRHGYVRGHHRPYVRGHTSRAIATEYVIEDRGYKTLCWIWQKGTAKQKYPYGLVYDENRRHLPAHRVYYERAKGPIPEGLDLDHLCRQPSCVNPDHLEPVTPAINTRRGNAAKLTEEDVAEIRRLSGMLTQREIGGRFGVTQSSVSRVLSRETWK